MKFGVLLPHFGRLGTPERVLSAARAAEQAGFHSVWVRDHLVYEPHGFEDQDPTFLEPFTTLAAVAAAAPAVTLGTAVIIPFRHPLVTAQSYLTLAAFARAGVMAGIGAGRFDHEFTAVGLRARARFTMTEEFAEILRLAFTSDRFNYEGRHFRIPEIWLTPRPRVPIPILMGGQTEGALRRAARCDGWLASRQTYATFTARLRRFREMREEAGRQDPPLVAMVALASIGDTSEEARRLLDVPAIIAEANRSPYLLRPPSGAFERFEDLAGMILAGTAAEICEGSDRFAALGVGHLIFDFRQDFAGMEKQMARLGREVLPRYRR
ncbi:MAG: LLM class flavin-dependent oxidoreductase [Armatimonadetes bacterium]|nr:LLM class flavin-dependent oxidoreductase [Armatimonadota bacterium]